MVLVCGPRSPPVKHMRSAIRARYYPHGPHQQQALPRELARERNVRLGAVTHMFPLLCVLRLTHNVARAPTCRNQGRNTDLSLGLMWVGLMKHMIYDTCA